MTAPYRSAAADLVAGDLRHEARLIVDPYTGASEFPADFTAATVTFSEDWSPYIQAGATAMIPAEQFRLDATDPRTLCRLRFEAGYTFPDGTTEIYPLADVALRDRRILRPSNTMRLDADSDESYTQDRLWRSTLSSMPTAGINEAVSWILGTTFAAQGYQLSSDYPNGTYSTELATLEVAIGDDLWRILAEIAARTGTRIYCDEAGIWRIRPRSDYAAGVRHYLRVGHNGTLTNTDAGLSRDGWYNAVTLIYEWEAAGTRHQIIGNASLASGPFATGAVGQRTYIERLNKKVTQSVADSTARWKLGNLASRGRSLRLTAIAAYWLRPGMTISVTLPTSEPEKHLIQSITFNLESGLMDLITRQPLDATITTGE